MFSIKWKDYYDEELETLVSGMKKTFRDIEKDKAAMRILKRTAKKCAKNRAKRDADKN